MKNTSKDKAQVWADKMLQYIKLNKGTTFVELQNICGKESLGDVEMYFEEQNIVMWSGVSQLFVDALNIIKQKLTITTSPKTHLTYLIDGKMLKYPMATKFKKYKNPHWIAVVLNAKPEPGEIRT